MINVEYLLLFKASTVKKIYSIFNIRYDQIRDVTTGAIGITAAAPKFLDT